MFFPAIGAGGGVGVASATHPAGPFKQASAGFLPGTDGADDPTIFLDHNGEGILCANGNKGCPAVPDGGCPDCGVLAADMVSWKTPPAVLKSFDKSAWHYFEAPWLLRRKDTYYLSFMMEYSTCPGNDGRRLPDPNCSWSHGGFDIGYSTAPAASNSSNPLAAAWQPKGTLMFSTDWDEQGGNNHQGIVEFPPGSDNWYMFYHSAWLSGNGLRRNIGVDRLYFNDSDAANPLLPVLATPNWLRAAVEHISPYAAVVPAFTMAQASTGVISRASDDVGAESVVKMSGDGAQNLCVDGIADQSWTHTRQVDFGGAAMGAQPGSAGIALMARVNVPECSVGDCPRLSMHLGTLEAPAAVTNCVLNSTSGEWATVRCPVTGILSSGVHDVFFLFEGGRRTGTMLTFSWWKLASHSVATGMAVAPPTPTPSPTPPAKATVQFTMRACAPHQCTWKAPAVSNVTGVPVGVATLGTMGSVLAAKAGVTAAELVLHDNEDGTWGIRVGRMARAVHVCATPQPAGKTGGAVLVLRDTAAAGDSEPCARFRVQVMTGGVYALRSTAIGLWVVVGADGVLQVEVEDPRSTPATAFTFTTMLGLPPH